MAKFDKKKKLTFVPTGLRTFQNFKAKERFTSWSQSALSDGLFLLFIVTWITPILIISVYITLSLGKLPDQVPLFYSRLWGESQLANRYYLFLPAAGTVLLGIFNLSLATGLHQRDKVSAYLLAGTATLISLLSSITIFSIINLMK